MRNVKVLNAVLMVANVALIVGIAGFAFEYLLQERKSLLSDVTPPIAEPPYPKPMNPRDLTSLRDLPNPIAAPVRTGPERAGSLRGVKLLGTDMIAGDPETMVAYLAIPARNLNPNAYFNIPVRDMVSEVDLPELSGWKLKSITPSTATFTNGGKDETLRVDDTVSVGPAGGNTPLVPGAKTDLAGTPWDKSKYASKKLDRSNENMEVWEIDKQEAAWAAQNWEAALRDVAMSIYSSGGVRIDSIPDGLAADRGFKANDVIKVVNGQSISDPGKLADMMKGLGTNQKVLTIQVDRSGRPYTLQFEMARTTKNPQ